MDPKEKPLARFPISTQVVYILLWILSLILILQVHRYTISTPDTPHYLTISRYYLHGEWWQALNSHWSPLVSWLLVPLLALKIEPLLAFFCIQGLTGIFCLLLWIKLLKEIELPAWLFHTAILLSFPLMWTGFIVLTPDFLTCTLFLFYFSVISRPDFISNRKYAIFSGVIAAFAFFGKSYALPFFIIHFILFHFWICFSQNRREGNKIKRSALFTSWIAGMIPFLLLTGIWTAALSSKFGEFTFSNAGKYNIVNYGPAGGDHIYYNRLIEPDTKYTRYDAFEEPWMFVPEWKEENSLHKFTYYIKRIFPNLSSLYYLTYLRDFAAIILICLISLALSRKIPSGRKGELFLLAGATLALYTGGYILLLIKARYLWFVYFLAAYLFWILIKYLWEERRYRNVIQFWVICTLIITLINYQDLFRGYVVGRIYGNKLYALQEKVADLPLEGKNVASNITNKGMVHSALNNLLRYYSNYKHWGHLVNDSLAEKGLDPEYEKQLDYFFLWNGPENVERVFKEYPLVLRDTTIGLLIYDLKGKKNIQNPE